MSLLSSATVLRLVDSMAAPFYENTRPVKTESSQWFLMSEAVHPSISGSLSVETGPNMESEATVAYSPGVGSRLSGTVAPKWSLDAHRAVSAP
jgi:hypothetical protein